MRIYSDDKVIVDYYSSGGTVIDVTFSGYTSLADRQPFGYNLSEKLSHSSLIVTARDNHYYHYNLDILIFKLIDILKNYKRISLYGCGMGGYAALKLSKILNANTVIVISPLVGDVYGEENKDIKDFNLKASDFGGEIFVLFDDKAYRDNKNFNYLKSLYKINDCALSYAGHIALAALKELKILNMLFMGSGEIELTKFFINKLKINFKKNSFHSTTVFCNYFISLNDVEKNELIQKIDFKNIKISNNKSDQFHLILADFFKNEANIVYLQALSLEKKDKELAKQSYFKAVDLDNSQIYWKFQCARFLTNNGLLDEAIKYYTDAIESAIADSVYYVFVSDWSNRLAKIYEKKAKRNESRKYYALGMAYDEEKTKNHQLRFNLNANDFVEVKRITQFVSDILPLCKSKIVQNYEKSQFSDYVFVYWGQGFDQAPDLIKKCLISIKKYSKGMNLVLLDDSNIENYIDIPLDIKEKFKLSKINHAHYSDILRVILLKKYGGCWIDATCLLTEPLQPNIQKILLKGEFFAFMYEKPMISNWFLCSQKESYVLSLMLNTLLEYWDSFLGHSYYFCFHAIFYALYILDERFKKEVDQALYFSTKIPHNLQVNMLKKFDESTFQSMLDKCFVHKLTYKFDKQKVLGSYLENILNRS